MKRRSLLAGAVALGCGQDMQIGFGLGIGFGGASAGGAAPASTPITILGNKLLRWIEIGAGSEVVSAPGITAPHGFATDLLDLSGNGYHVTAASTQQAMYEPAGWNGLPSIAFDGGNDFYVNTDTGVGAHATALIGGLNTACTVFSVEQFFVTNVLQVPYSCGANAATPLLDIFLNTTPNYCATKNFGSAKTLVGTTVANTARHILDLQNQGTQAQLSLNGTPLPGAGYVASNFSTVTGVVNRDCVGALNRNTTSNFLKGRLVAQITMTGVPTAGEYTAMMAYLAKFTAAATAPMLVIAGDSLSTTDRWQVDFAAAYPSATISNGALGGQLLSGYGTPNIERDGWSNYDSNRSATLLSAQWGSNDIINGTAGATLHTNLTNYVSAVKAKNPAEKIMVATMQTRAGISGPQETERQAFNTAIRSSLAGANYLLDRDVISPTLGDGTHPDTAGNTKLWNGANGAQGIHDFVIAAGF